MLYSTIYFDLQYILYLYVFIQLRRIDYIIIKTDFILQILI